MASLQRLLLRGVFLGELLCLLLVSLFERRYVGVGRPLMLGVLPLLKLLPLLGLPRDQLVLLLFVLLIGPRIPRVDRRWTRDGGKIIRMDYRA